MIFSNKKEKKTMRNRRYNVDSDRNRIETFGMSISIETKIKN